MPRQSARTLRRPLFAGTFNLKLNLRNETTRYGINSAERDRRLCTFKPSGAVKKKKESRNAERGTPEKRVGIVFISR